MAFSLFGLNRRLPKRSGQNIGGEVKHCSGENSIKIQSLCAAVSANYHVGTGLNVSLMPVRQSCDCNYWHYAALITG